jgi:probable O-glycosylation ligase (exosortase A-associated)
VEKGLIFTYLLTYGGVLVSLGRPFVGLLIYICFAILKPEALWYWSVPRGNYSRIVAIGLLVGWALHGFGNWSFGRAAPIVLAFILYVCWSAVCAFQCVADSALAFAQVEDYLKILLPFLVGITMIRTIGQLKQLAWIIVLSQGYLAYEFNMQYIGSRGFDPNDWHHGGLDRNGIAITMVTAAGFAFFLGIHAARWWAKLLALALAALMSHVVMFSMSRGGMLSLVVTGVVTFILIPKRPSYIAVFLLAAVLGLRLAGPKVVERFLTTTAEAKTRDESAQSRLELWQALIQVTAQHPVVGVGPQNWRPIASSFGFTEGKDGHSTWLMVLAEMGIPGLALLVCFYAICMLRLLRFTRDSYPVPDPWFRYFARMVLASFAGFAISAQFVTVYAVELPYYVVLIGAGVLVLSSDVNAEVPHSVPREELEMI